MAVCGVVSVSSIVPAFPACAHRHYRGTAVVSASVFPFPLRDGVGQAYVPLFLWAASTACACLLACAGWLAGLVLLPCLFYSRRVSFWFIFACSLIFPGKTCVCFLFWCVTFRRTYASKYDTLLSNSHRQAVRCGAVRWMGDI